MQISIIAAIGPRRELGKDNRLLWHISEDFKRFKKITQGHAVIMGRRTFESIGKPLPNRLNIIITRNKDKYSNLTLNWSNQVIICGLLEEAINLLKNKKFPATNYQLPTTQDEVFIIGGGQIYHQGLPLADKLYLTVVEKTPEHPDGKFEADTFFPDYSEFKKIVFKEEKESEEYKYTFLELEK